jgi:hypothetical protein
MFTAITFSRAWVLSAASPETITNGLSSRTPGNLCRWDERVLHHGVAAELH